MNLARKNNRLHHKENIFLSGLNKVLGETLEK